MRRIERMIEENRENEGEEEEMPTDD